MTTSIETDASDSDKQRLLTDLSSNNDGLGWYVVNDNVMGGRSEGDFVRDSGQLRFAGATNTNGGGFSSIRTANLQLDVSAYDGIRLRVKGDGRRYTWRLTSTATFRGRPVSFWADFATESNDWSTVDIPFADFIPKYRGSRLNGPTLDLANITGMGLMIYDGKDGPFELMLDEVQVYTGEDPD